ncbi:hypothetical protein RJD38_14150 [Vibrio scophthalmi]|uniref:Uncharacterized protein n=1 Tax=Vibrio scophthalmi TaxID=45658 RepID=A0A1C7FAP5_9VIBR|nr:hypothetical protein [Vibrio scophthalmi]ANU36434.1 hypothetical protein VSVS05_01307 [Vibrio scophthalmi]
MAAQKLTKGRFVQIIIMLTVLIVAFFWRTFNYEAEKKTSCKLQQPCAFYVNDAQFFAQFSPQEIKIVTPNDSWEIDGAIALKAAKNTWQLNNSLLRNITVRSKENDETTHIEFVVQGN